MHPYLLVLSGLCCMQVHCILEKMKVTGVDCLLDCHADETLPYAFLAGIEGDARCDLKKGLCDCGLICQQPID